MVTAFFTAFYYLQPHPLIPSLATSQSRSRHRSIIVPLSGFYGHETNG